jgi:ribosomal protein L40E
MDNSINDFHSLISEFTPPSSIIEDMEILCQGLENIFAGQSAEMTVFSHRLVRLLEWAKLRPAVEDTSAAAGWHAKYAGLPGFGGTLTCQNDAQELVLSFDSTHTAYLGAWRSLRPGEEDHGGLFSIEDSKSGKMLVVDTGLKKQQIALPDTEGLIWGDVASFLQSVQDEKPQQPEPPETQLAPASPVPVPQPSVSNVELPPDAHPTILAKPVKRQPLPVMPLPSKNAKSKPALGEQSAKINPEIWQCACGSRNAGLFCPKCGSEKPTPVVVQKSTPVQPTFCRQCGEVLTPGARFCRNCGTETLG